ncbi:MAG: efflux RND transporter periplasmic adaptor subunit [Gemmatimonadota bacterium]
MPKFVARRCPALLALLLSATGLACGGGADADAPPKPVSISNPVTEASLTTVTLSAEAERRLAIAVDTVAVRPMEASRSLPGEVMAAPGMSQQLVAPVAGRVTRAGGAAPPPSGARVSGGAQLLALIPIATDLGTASTTEALQIAEARLTRARLEAERVTTLWRDRLVSARDREVAEAELAIAQAARDAAEGRAMLTDGTRGTPDGVTPLVVRAPFDGVVRALLVGEGQLVAAGTPLLEVVRLASVWVRVAAYVGDIGRLDTRARASIQPLGAPDGARVLPAMPVAAPPSADPLSASADLYYEVANVGVGLRPGERVQVAVPLRGARSERLTVPWASVVFDHEGGSWVYERLGDHQYARRRIVLGEVVREWAEVRSGIAAGALVVTAGAAELLGTEFGAGK